jgi:hypothetical protein
LPFFGICTSRAAHSTSGQRGHGNVIREAQGCV